jgi:Flp pilus assembly protein TadG
MLKILKPLNRLPRNKAGNVTIEFGFVVLFMATLAIGAYDFGNLGYQKIAITNAARAGSQYGVQDMSTAEDLTGMVQAARNDIDDTANALNINASNYYFCPNQTPNVVADESVLCDDGSYSYFYVEVTVEHQIDLLFPYPYVTSPQAIASTNTMRVR